MAKEAQRSRCRQRLLALMEHLGRLSRVAQERSGILRASIYQRRRRCGKQRCRCSRGRLHGQTAVSVYRSGQSRLMSLEGLESDKLSDLVGNYRQFRTARSEMVQTFGQLLKTFDDLGRLREVALRDLPRSSQSA